MIYQISFRSKAHPKMVTSVIEREVSAYLELSPLCQGVRVINDAVAKSNPAEFFTSEYGELWHLYIYDRVTDSIHNDIVSLLKKAPGVYKILQPVGLEIWSADNG